MSEVERQVVLLGKKKTKIRTTRVPAKYHYFSKMPYSNIMQEQFHFNSTHTVNNCGCGLLFFLFFCQGRVGKGSEKQLWLCDCTHTVNNCGCLIQWTIVTVGFSFFFLLSGSRGRRQRKNKKKWIIVRCDKRKIIKK